MDITLCTDSRCPSRKTCLRWLARKSEHPRQSYADFGRGENDRCDDGYWPVAPEPKRNIRE